MQSHDLFCGTLTSRQLTVVENTNVTLSCLACLLACILPEFKQSRLSCSLIGLRDVSLDLLIDFLHDVVLDYKMYVLLVLACFLLDVRCIFISFAVDVSLVCVCGISQCLA